MSVYLVLGVLLFVLPWNLYWLLVRPAVRQRRAAVAVAEPPPVPELEPRAPRDISRTYPRPGRTRSKLTRICPVCGMEDPGDLDGKVFGWPAHRSCAEWLGEWKPERRFPVASVTEIAEAKTAVSVNESPGAQVNVGSGNAQIVWTESGTIGPIVAMAEQGVISLNEARERLDREIIASWGVPPMMLQERTHKAGDPAPIERCPNCGAQFAGLPDYLRMAFEMHRQAGCRQSSSLPA